MRHRLLHVSAAVCVLLSVVSPVSTSADDLSAAQAKQSQASQDVARYKALYAQAKAQVASLEVQKGALASLIAASEQQLADQNALLDTIQGQLDATQRQLEQTRAHLADREAVLAQRTRGLYKQGGDISLLDSLFTSSTFAQLMERFLVMKDVAHADQLLVSQVKADKASIENLAAQQVIERDARAQQVQEIKAHQDDLRTQYVERNALEAQAAVAESSAQQNAQKAQAAFAAASAEVASLVAARGRAHSSGVFAWPGVQGPLTQNFGCTDFAGEPPPPPGYSCPPKVPYFHTGIDIAGPYGSEVDATDGGIAYTYPGNSGYGNHVIIVHQNGFASLYGHLASFAVSSGQAVTKGQKIGFEGSTGFSSGPHLHFEIRLNNAPQDPCRYVGC